MFLGGVGEIGKNMTAFEYGDSIVVLDAGMSFPGSDMPGVDVVIPDVSYLVENRDRIKGILITHGHEDHIGALPFLVEQLGIKVDVYGTRLTLALAENKLVEHNVADRVRFVPITDKSVVNLGQFSAEFIHVSHSVAGSVAICLRTPVGIVLHTGDFKVDYTPLGNDIMNLNRFAEIGKQGVLLLMSESTNVEKPGYTMSESVVQETINKVFQEAKGRRIIIATFASNVDRVGMIIELAKLYRRKIALSGKSMNKYVEAAARVGTLNIDSKMFVDIDKIGNIEDGRLLILSTGSQGEPMSALTRMASGEFNKVKIGSNDTIVISANPIPGNERDVYNVINKLYRLGANVVYSALSAVHVSGHACQEELKLIYTLVKPKYFIPVHGEYRHLKQHAMLVEHLKHKKNNIIIPEIGDCVELDKNTFKVVGQITGGSVMVDGLGVGDVGNAVLRDRLSLAEDGILVCVVGLNKNTGKIGADIEIVSRGCFFAGDADAPIDELRSLVKQEITKLNGASISAIKTAIQRVVRHYFRVTLKRNPVVLPIIFEI
ncbi:MAG: ribonuclease J [Clostridiales bacterium]|nr:ribonuclease J [Clostridiales bacterium]